MSEEVEEAPQVLTASVHDVRYFAALLRGVNFSNRATVTITQAGLIVSVEEARTLLATAYIFFDIFDEYAYRSEAPPAPTEREVPQTQLEDQEDDTNVAFEIPLNTLVECLNIFGTASSSTSALQSSANTARYRKWRRAGEESDGEEAGGNEGDGKKRGGARMTGNARIETYFGGEKGTGMRMSYTGAGYPLTLLIAEDSDGPTATCEVTTFEPEPQLELPFDSNQTVLKIILKSSWLRDALSELDPSTDKLSIIGNPPPPPGRAPQRLSQPRLRLKAVGTFGSTEMDYPNDKEVLETCECSTHVNFSYRFSHITRAIRALQTSTKTSLRIDHDGLLSLQFLMPSPKPMRGGSSDAFIEFRCMALDDGTV